MPLTIALLLVVARRAGASILLLNGFHQAGPWIGSTRTVLAQWSSPFGLARPLPVGDMNATLVYPWNPTVHKHELFAGAACLYNGADLYVDGGHQRNYVDCRGVAYKYNIESGQFTSLPPCCPNRYGRCYHSLSCWHKYGLLVSCGGSDRSSPYHNDRIYDTCHTLHVDNPAAGWTLLENNMTKPLYMHAAAVVADRLYVTGGFDHPAGMTMTRALKETYMLSEPSGDWVKVPTEMADGRAGHSVAVLNGRRLIACGGVTVRGGAPVRSCDALVGDFAHTDRIQWERMGNGALNTARRHFAFVNYYV